MTASKVPYRRDGVVFSLWIGELVIQVVSVAMDDDNFNGTYETPVRWYGGSEEQRAIMCH